MLNLTPSPTHSHLRLIREEDSPTYDGEWQITQVVLAELEPAPQEERRHMTVVDDEVMWSIGSTLGHTAFAVYMVLEKHADKSGNCHPSQQTIAAWLKLSERWVRDAIAALADGGYIVVKKRTNRFGAQLSDSYELPNHPRTYRAEEPPELSPELNTTFTSAKVVTEVVTSKENVKKTPPKKSRAISHATQVPEDLLQLIPADVWQAMKAETQLSDEQMRFETAMMIDRNLAKEGTSKNWIASWRSWLRSPYRKSQPSSNGAWVPSHV